MLGFGLMPIFLKQDLRTLNKIVMHAQYFAKNMPIDALKNEPLQVFQREL